MKKSRKNLFDLKGRVAVITGGLGLLGQQHAEVIAGHGGIPVLVDLHAADPLQIRKRFGPKALSLQGDITGKEDVIRLLGIVLKKFKRIDILINNAANNPKVEKAGDLTSSRLENFSLDRWRADLAVGLDGAFLCSQIFGAEMARRKKGVIVNIASDLAVIAPDQRIYRKQGAAERDQPVKPVTYSVVKTGLLGLTRYLATYWAEQGVRVNALSPGGIYTAQPEDFVVRLSNLIPMARMAKVDEYQGALLFLCSDASSYMTGSNLVVDGGRTCW